MLNTGKTASVFDCRSRLQSWQNMKREAAFFSYWERGEALRWKELGSHMWRIEIEKGWWDNGQRELKNKPWLGMRGATSLSISINSYSDFFLSFPFLLLYLPLSLFSIYHPMIDKWVCLTIVYLPLLKYKPHEVKELYIIHYSLPKV